MVDSYVIRIYRRRKKDARILVGVVENAGMEGMEAFHNLDELWAILKQSKDRGSRRRPGEGRGRARRQPDTEPGM